MRWSWLWEGTAVPPLGDVPAAYVALIDCKFKSCPPSLPANDRHAALRIAGDASTKAPRLSASISPITRRALAVLEPDLLHELLTLDGEALAAPRSTHSATPRSDRNQHARWRRIAETLRSLAADMHVDGCAETQPCFLLEQWAKQADAHALQPPAMKPVTRASDAALDRTRLSILAEALAASSQRWTAGDLADLVAASQTDWRVPPTKLAAVDPQRSAIEQWIAGALGR